MSRWNTNKREKEEDGFEGDVQSETNSSSERLKPEPASSVLHSEKSQNGDAANANGDSTPTVRQDSEMASSPAPQVMEVEAA